MKNISGFWVGRYGYGKGWDKAVSFDAEITDDAGTLTGVITEPNTFDPEAGDLLSASLTGAIADGKIDFLKTYVGEGTANHSVHYSGQFHNTENLIRGVWNIGDFQGRFEMRRDGPVVAVKAGLRTASLERVIEDMKVK